MLWVRRNFLLFFFIHGLCYTKAPGLQDRRSGVKQDIFGIGEPLRHLTVLPGLLQPNGGFELLFFSTFTYPNGANQKKNHAT